MLVFISVLHSQFQTTFESTKLFAEVFFFFLHSDFFWWIRTKFEKNNGGKQTTWNSITLTFLAKNGWEFRSELRKLTSNFAVSEIPSKICWFELAQPVIPISRRWGDDVILHNSVLGIFFRQFPDILKRGTFRRQNVAVQSKNFGVFGQFQS